MSAPQARILAHVENFARVVMAQGAEVVELRALQVSNGNGRPRTISGYYTSAAALARDAVSLNGTAGGVYITMDAIDARLLARSENRLTPYPKATTSDDQVERRLWLKVDLDPVRPSGISASDAEKAAAEALALRVRDDLAGEGWPTPIVNDSGNGWHLLYRIDLPNDDQSKLLVEGVLRALAQRYDNADVKVDTTTANAARIWKLPGTLTKKGDNTPDRPHRYARAVELPEHLEMVDVALLEALAAEVAQAEPERRVGARTAEFDLTRWVEANRGAIEARCGKITERQADGWWFPAHKWKQLYVLEKCWRNPEEHNRQEVHFGQLTDGKLGAGCKHASCSGEGWTSFREAIEPGYRERRERKAQESAGKYPEGGPAEPAEEHDTDTGNAARFVRLHGETVRYCYPMRSWLVWDGSRWAPDDNGRSLALAKDVAVDLRGEAAQAPGKDEREALWKRARRAEQAKGLRDLLTCAAPDVAVRVDALDAAPWLLNTPGRTLNLHTGETYPPRQADCITKITGAPFDPGAEAPTWTAFLLRIFANRERLIR